MGIEVLLFKVANRTASKQLTYLRVLWLLSCDMYINFLRELWLPSLNAQKEIGFQFYFISPLIPSRETLKVSQL
jgi:hypothetical protein